MEKTALPNEARVRSFYMEHLNSLHPEQRCVGIEVGYRNSSVRADARTVNKLNLRREWEFKIGADYSALGQILTYMATAKHDMNFKREIRGVIAAFSFRTDLVHTIEVLNPNVELVTIPNWVRYAGRVPMNLEASRPPSIPSKNKHLMKYTTGE